MENQYKGGKKEVRIGDVQAGGIIEGQITNNVYIKIGSDPSKPGTVLVRNLSTGCISNVEINRQFFQYTDPVVLVDKRSFGETEERCTRWFNRNQELHEDLQSTDNQCTDLSNRNKRLHTLLDEKREEIRTLIDRNKRLHATYKEKVNYIDKLFETLIDARNKVDQWKNRHDKVEAELIQKRAELLGYKNVGFVKQGTITGADFREAELRSELKKTKNKLEEYRKWFNDGGLASFVHIDKYKTIEEENNRLQERVLALQGLLEGTRYTLDQKIESHEILSKRYDRAIERHRRSEVALTKSRQECVRLQKEIESLQDSNKDLMKQLDNFKIGYMNSDMGAQKVIEDLSQQLHRAHCEKGQLEVRIDQLNTKNRELGDLLEQKISENEQKPPYKDLEIERLRAENAGLKMALDITKNTWLERHKTWTKLVNDLKNSLHKPRFDG